MSCACSRPKADAADDILADSSQSRLLSSATVLPRYVNFVTALSGWSSIRIEGAVYNVPGAGWNMTSVFLALTARPKEKAVLANLLTRLCKSCSEFWCLLVLG